MRPAYLAEQRLVPRPNVCFAVGGSASVSSSPTPLIERWDGANWSHQPTRTSETAGSRPLLLRVPDCTAVGGTFRPGGTDRATACRALGRDGLAPFNRPRSSRARSSAACAALPAPSNAPALPSVSRSPRPRPALLAARRALGRADQRLGAGGRAEARRRHRRRVRRGVLSARTGVLRRRRFRSSSHPVRRDPEADPCRAPRRLELVGHAHPESDAAAAGPIELRARGR